MRPHEPYYANTGGASLGRALATLATRLKTCRASFFVETEDFLIASDEEALRYPRLRHLVLTSRCLSRQGLGRWSRGIELLLLSATRFAFLRTTPKLEKLDL